MKSILTANVDRDNDSPDDGFNEQRTERNAVHSPAVPDKHGTQGNV